MCMLHIFYVLLHTYQITDLPDLSKFLKLATDKTHVLKVYVLIIEANFRLPDLWMPPRGGFLHAEFDSAVQKITNSFNQSRTNRIHHFKEISLKPDHRFLFFEGLPDRGSRWKKKWFGTTKQFFWYPKTVFWYQTLIFWYQQIFFGTQK